VERREHSATRQRRRWLAALTLVAFTVALGCFGFAGALALGAQSPPSQTRRSLPPPDAQAIASASAAPKAASGRQMPRPVRIVIPAIAVSAPVIPLHLNRNRTLQVPKSFSQTGWFVGGPEPGENGAAVIVGHVDSKSGPAVFYRLRALRRGDVIKVVLKNKSTVRFVVRSTRKVPKKRFPTKLVYGKTKDPTLRLITCDGRFDRSTGHYVDNHLVFASIA
jgi:LPXTG-site transpeptidase (sortase) family protein